MKWVIKYMEDLEWKKLSYSDAALVKEIQKRVKQTEANRIEMHFCEEKHNQGTVMVCIMHIDNHLQMPKLTASSTICLHEINLESENWKDNLSEFQREKRILQRAFPRLKVSSNFR